MATLANNLVKFWTTWCISLNVDYDEEQKAI